MKSKFYIQPVVYIIAAFSIIFIPFPWLFAWCTAVIIHEVFHFIALKLFHIPVYRICIGLSGVTMQTEEGTDLQMCICALVGPLSGILLLMLLNTVPRVALCGGLLSLYNLIPIYPLDGGRAFRGLMRHVIRHKNADCIILTFECTILLLLMLASIYAATILKWGILPVLCYLIILVRNKKDLANIVKKRYNSHSKKA